MVGTQVRVCSERRLFGRRVQHPDIMLTVRFGPPWAIRSQLDFPSQPKKYVIEDRCREECQDRSECQPAHYCDRH